MPRLLQAAVAGRILRQDKIMGPYYWAVPILPSSGTYIQVKLFRIRYGFHTSFLYYGFVCGLPLHHKYKKISQIYHQT
uniref:Uncharacterized protein n=1 Tax=Leersia perrieri TaxID=77586 RepID=A0A0D9V164_9ORYZ